MAYRRVGRSSPAFVRTKPKVGAWQKRREARLRLEAFQRAIRMEEELWAKMPVPWVPQLEPEPHEEDSYWVGGALILAAIVVASLIFAWVAG